MDNTNQVQEKIKIATEWLRMYFVFLLTDSSGTIALATGIFKEQSNRVEIIFTILGLFIALLLVIRMYIINKKINKLIHQLNQNK